MTLNLKPVPESKLRILASIFQHRVEESNLVGRTSVSELLVKLERGYSNRSMAAFVDDLDNPRCCLVMSMFFGLVTDDRYANIVLVYAAPELRGRKEYGEALIRTAEAHARLNKASTLMGTSWLYKGSKDIGWFWKRNGFEPQETIYVKHLTS